MKKDDEEEMSWILCKFGFEFEWWLCFSFSIFQGSEHERDGKYCIIIERTL
jgi:hypothetical protein